MPFTRAGGSVFSLCTRSGRFSGFGPPHITRCMAMAENPGQKPMKPTAGGPTTQLHESPHWKRKLRLWKRTRPTAAIQNPDATSLVMDLLLILTYAAFAYGAFRVFKIPVNGFTLLTAALGGVALLGALLLGMNYNHPFTSEARFYFNTTPIVPGVSGVVTEVPVKGNTHIKTGEVLFRIDPTPFENAVKAKEAVLADAVQTTHQLRATADAAQKKLESALADRDGALDVYERSKKLIAEGVIAQIQFEKPKNNY